MEQQLSQRSHESPIRIVLDSPDGLSIRYQNLGISLSDAEQATFFARWGDDIQGVIADGFGKLEKAVNRLTFLAETQLPLSHLTVLLDLNREYSGKEIGHFRAFCDFWLVEEKAGIAVYLFGTTDIPKRLDAKSEAEIKLHRGGIEHGFCEVQWNGRFETEKHSGILTPHGPKYERVSITHHIGAPLVQRVAFRYATDELFRMRPYLELRDLDGARFVFLMNQSLFAKLESIRVYANEYKIAEFPKDAFQAESPNSLPDLPVIFTKEELVDSWLLVRKRGVSTFNISFSETTPRRFFSPVDVEPEEK